MSIAKIAQTFVDQSISKAGLYLLYESELEVFIEDVVRNENGEYIALPSDKISIYGWIKCPSFNSRLCHSLTLNELSPLDNRLDKSEFAELLSLINKYFDYSVKQLILKYPEIELFIKNSNTC